MVSGLRIEGGTQIVSSHVRKSIQSIKEIFRDHSEADIYSTLKETNMDPNETVQILLNQDPFHEVKRKRDKKKENVAHRDVNPKRHYEDMGQEKIIQTFSDRNGRRLNYPRNALPGINREFRIVRDNRMNLNTREPNPTLLQLSTSNNEQSLNVPKKSFSPTGTSSGQKSSGGRNSLRAPNGSDDSQPSNIRDGYTNATGRKYLLEDKQAAVLTLVPKVHALKTDGSRNSEIQESSTVGVYSSATDPVHVPSPDSRSSALVGAIKREVGVGGVRQQSSDGLGSHASAPVSSVSNSHVGRDGSSKESFRPFISISKVVQPNKTTESFTPSIGGSKPFLSNPHHSKHQQHTGHHKASHPNMEWKPKSSQKLSVNNHNVIGTLTKSTPSAADESKDLASKEVSLQDKLSRVNINENQNVIIAQHIRVPKTDQCQLTFGSFGTDSEPCRTLVSEVPSVCASGNSNVKPEASLPGSPTDEALGRKPVDFEGGQVQISESDSPVSGVATELQLPDKIASSSTQDLSNYTDIGMGRESSPPYANESHHLNSSDLSRFSAYDPQTCYDTPYFRPTVDDPFRIQGLPSPHDSLSAHSASIPASSFAMVQQQQQQQQPVAQMYPQVHLSHFANLMPYRQILSPVYVPPMAMPGYSSNPAYPHPSNGSSYLLMSGGNSHMNTNSLKYGIQQFKPVPGTPTGFGNFSNPSGYAINAPGVIGSANALEDSSRMKYKDGNLYVPNPQAETSEVWIQNPREVQNLQSAPYYSMAGQAPHGAYLPSHTGLASFNVAASQSSHMQYPGLYHPSPQPPNPHHMGTGMGGNVGAGVAAAAPSPQVGAYQQPPPQLGHFNWTTNF